MKLKNPVQIRAGLELWYNGCQTAGGQKLYNPRSVVGALTYNQLCSYWTSWGPYDEIFSAMVVYGFLNYKDGYVSIPNKELMDKFTEVVQRDSSLGNVYKLTKESGRILAVGIAYNKEDQNKRHECKVEVLHGRIK